MKVDRWGWQPDNKLLSCASVTELFPITSMYPMSPSPPTFYIILSLYFPLHPFLTHITQSVYPFSHFIPTFIINMFPQIYLVPPSSPPSPSRHSFTHCHYGPMLTEAFIKCQLYTRDHTVEGEDTMISDPKRSTCLWAFSSCWRTDGLL